MSFRTVYASILHVHLLKQPTQAIYTVAILRVFSLPNVNEQSVVNVAAH